MELEDLISQSIEDWHPEFVDDYQEELDLVTKKLTHLENDTRKAKTKANLWLEWRIF
jgi:hypothetical protein